MWLIILENTPSHIQYTMWFLLCFNEDFDLSTLNLNCFLIFHETSIQLRKQYFSNHRNKIHIQTTKWFLPWRAPWLDHKKANSHSNKVHTTSLKNVNHFSVSVAYDWHTDWHGLITPLSIYWTNQNSSSHNFSENRPVFCHQNIIRMKF